MKKILGLFLMLSIICTFTVSVSANTQITQEDTIMSRTIPEEAFLYKEGLYIHERIITLGSLTRTAWDLYSAEGWCFYDLQQPENYDEEGNLLPAEDRVYAQFMTMTKDEYYVTNYIICVPVEDGYEIVSAGSNQETA